MYSADASRVLWAGCNLDVAIIAPAGAPGILYNVVYVSSVAAIANTSHSMVQSRATVWISHHARLVVSERSVSSIEGQRDRSSLNGGKQSFVRFGLDLHNSINSGMSLDVLTRSNDTFVRIVSFISKTSVLE